MICPFCGNELPLGNWEHQELIEYHAGPGNPTLIAPGTTWTRREPARPASVESDVAVPLLQSLACGAMAGLVITGLTLAFHWPWWAPCLAIGGGTAVTWFLLLGDHRRLLWRAEEIIGGDLDGDGQVGEPEPRIVRVELSEPEKRTMRYVDLPVCDEVLERVAVAVLKSGYTFSRRGLAGVISDGDFRVLHTAMLRAGLACYKDSKPNAGTELTPAGRAILGHYL